MKKTFITFLLLAALFAGFIFIFAIPKAEKDILAQLQTLGFKDAKIQNTIILPTGIRINQITLDTDGFSTIHNLRAAMFWPTYLFEGNIDSVFIDEINLASITENLSKITAYKRNFDLKKISALPVKNIQIKKILWDTTTPQGAIRFEITATIQQENGKGVVQSSISAKQRQLAFDSQWAGSFDVDTIEIDGTFNDLNINYSPLNVHRGTGWISYYSENENSKMAGQFDAGSGKLFNVPASNISLVIGQNENYFPVLFRAQASGIEDVIFTTDIHYAAVPEEQLFGLHLKVKNPADFLTYLKQQNLIKNNLDTGNINTQDALNIKLDYMPEKRFAEGPMPFDIIIERPAEKTLQGTFLIYPDSLDIRGTAESNENFLNFLKNAGLVKEKNITGTFVRLDGNLKSLIE